MSDERDIPHGPVGWVSQETYEALGKSKMNVIGNMRETITALRAENEALRARYATATELADKLAEAVKLDLQAMTPDEQRLADEAVFTAHEDYLVSREHDPDNEAKARDLRKQADAVEALNFP